VKNEENSSLFARYLKTLVPRIGRNLNFRELKCRKFFYTKLDACGKFDNTKLGILATRISRQGKKHFQTSKIRKFPFFARYLETLVSRIGRNRIFRMPKCLKFAYTKLRTIELWVSRVSKYRIFQPPKCRK